jgi:Peptidase propeptide and YPEB domain
MQGRKLGWLALIALVGAAWAAPAAAQDAMRDRTYVGQMSEDQIKQKLAGEGFSQISEVKKVPVTRYRWTAKGVQNGKPVEIMIDELGHVAAK